MDTASSALLDRALVVAREAANAAAVVIRKYYRRDIAVEIKPDQTPVTVADREAEAEIKRVLKREFPDHAFYGEESGREGDSEFLWLIDPIDGTKAFVRGYPMFSTQIALTVRGELLLGVSSALEFGETAWARRGGGAFLNGERVHVASTSTLDSRAAISIGNIKTLTDGARWNVLGELVRSTGRIRGYGDFYHYHLLARGCIDLVVESDVNILDVAALAVIVREAGGTFSDLDGRELDLGTRSVLAGTPALHAIALQRFTAAGAAS